MDARSRLRDSLKNEVLSSISINFRNPFSTYGNIAAKDYHVLIAKLPADEAPAVIILDPTSPNYGDFIFVVDFSSIDGPDIIV